MSKLFVNEIAPKTGNTISITGYTPAASSNSFQQSGSLVTTDGSTSAHNFVIPSGANRIQCQSWALSGNGSGVTQSRLGTTVGGVATSGYDVSNYVNSFSTATKGQYFGFSGYTATANVWYTMEEYWSIDDGRRWFGKWRVTNTGYDYRYLCKGFVDLGAGNTCINFQKANSGVNFDAGGLIAVHYATY